MGKKRVGLATPDELLTVNNAKRVFPHFQPIEGATVSGRYVGSMFYRSASAKPKRTDDCR